MEGIDRNSKTDHQGLNCNYCEKSDHKVKECRKRLREQDPENTPGSSGERTIKDHKCEPEAAKAPEIESRDPRVTLIRLRGQLRNSMKIKLSSEDLKRDITMLIVPEMRDNLLKISALKSISSDIDGTTDFLNLRSLGNGAGNNKSYTRSLDRVEIKILNELIPFQIIDDDFEIPDAGDGIISSNFFYQHKDVSIGNHVMKINGLPFPLFRSSDESIPLDLLNERQSIPDPQNRHFIHSIKSPDDLINPYFPKPRFSLEEEAKIAGQVAELLARDIIVPSVSPYNFPVLLVPAKDEHSILSRNEKMLAVDYKLLNENTVADNYPLPKIIDILEKMGGAKYFSILQLAGGFYQIPITDRSAPKTAFSTHQGHFQFNRMPPGLKNGDATLQRRMDEAFRGMLGKGMFAYLGSIVVYTDSFDSHLEKLKKVFNRLERGNFSVDLRKCEYAKSRVVYFDHLISENGIGMDPKKIEEVKNFPRPKSVKDIHQFLNLAGFYKRFVKDFSRIAKPLTNLLRKDIEFQWTDDQERAFQELRKNLCDQPFLNYPDFDKPFVLITEAFEYALGVTLSQIKEGKILPISFASRSLNTAEENYSKIEKEILAIVYAVEDYRSHLFGKKFLLVTDRESLEWLDLIENPPSRIANWKTKLAEFEYKIVNK